MTSLTEKYVAKGLRLTESRRILLDVLDQSNDHPDIFTLHDRAKRIDPTLSQATVYRTMRLLEEVGLVDKRDFGDGRARYEDADKDHHDHLINLETGEIIEFQDANLKALKEAIADRLGFELKDHRLELFGMPKKQ